MEDQVQNLANKTWKKFQTLDASKRYLIALAGIPGSGKTTTAASIVQHLNLLHHQAFHAKWPNSSIHRTASQPDIATVIPLDGYHLTRNQLSAMPNPEEAHYRRGAAFTFDAPAYLKLVTQLRSPLQAETRTIHAPSFDHTIKDPVQNDIHIPPTARILIFEGLYTALDEPIWSDAASKMDAIWFIDTPIPLATERVAKRNFAAGLSPSYEAAVERTEANDMRNAREILDKKVEGIDEVITSVEDAEWKNGVPGAAAIEGNDEADDDENGVDDEKRLRMERMDSIAEMAECGGGC